MMRTVIFSRLTILVLILILINSCKQITIISVDKESINQFHQATQKAKKLDPKTSLFVDYSTCGVFSSSSEFFNRIKSRITGQNPVLYRLKGQYQTERFSDNKDIIDHELNTIQFNQTNYADIPGACQKICSGNNQAILMTDGEYITPNFGVRLDLAYMKDSFITWLSKGFEIYILTEDYEENGNDKKIFYFLFTDDDLPNNIFKELNKAIDFTSLNPSIKLFKLSNSDFESLDEFIVHNQISSMLLDRDSNSSAFEIDDDWKVIDKYILNAKNPEDLDDNIPGGDYLIRGLKLSSNQYSHYKLNELELIVYDISSKYLEMQRNNFKDKTDLNDEKKVDDIFSIDNDLFKTSGEIGIKVHENYANALSDTCDNLFRIDIIVKKLSIKPITVDEFSWGSLTKNERNTSVYESIKQSIDDHKIDPAECKQVLYTIYLKTSPLK
jgi:hypothetical protein